MTVEEAKYILYGIRADNLNLDDIYTKDKYDALGIAIKALEQEPCEDAISRQAVLELVADYDLSMGQVVKGIHDLPPVNSQPKTGHWAYKIYGGFHEQGNWHCSHCDYQYNYGNGHAKFCPECGYEMSEPSTEEVIRDRDYDWIIKR